MMTETTEPTETSRQEELKIFFMVLVATVACLAAMYLAGVTAP